MPNRPEVPREIEQAHEAMRVALARVREQLDATDEAIAQLREVLPDE